MKLLDLQHKSEELLEQLNQLNDISAKFQENSALSTDAVTRSVQIIGIAEQLLVQVNTMLTSIDSFMAEETKELNNLKASVLLNAAEQGSQMKQTFNTDHTNFVSSIKSEMESVQAVFANLIDLTANANAEMREQSLELKRVVTATAQTQQETFNTEHSKFVSNIKTEMEGVQTAFSRLMDLIANATADMRSEVMKLEKTVNATVQTQQKVVEDEMQKLHHNIESFIFERSNFLTVASNEMKQNLANSETLITQKLKKQSAVSRNMHLIQFILLFALILMAAFPYVKKFL